MERLLKIYSQEIHAPTTKKFNKRSVKVNKVNELWSADLVEMGALKEYNDGYIYLLNIIDVFSRRVWAFPLKDKKANTILTNFKSAGISSTCGGCCY